VQLWDDTGKVASFTSNFTFVIKSLNSSAQATHPIQRIS